MPTHTHTVTDPGHTHTAGAYPILLNGTGGTTLNTGGGFLTVTAAATNSSATGITNQNAGSGTAMDFAVQYVDVIIATKD
jgi:hypothetical protein